MIEKPEDENLVLWPSDLNQKGKQHKKLHKKGKGNERYRLVGRKGVEKEPVVYKVIQWPSL